MSSNQGAHDSRWFAEDEVPALRDFWQIYDLHYDEIQAALLPLISKHEKFGPLMASLSQEQQAAQSIESRQRLTRAVEDGDWSAYIQRARSQGAWYAALGVSFTDWYYLVGLFGRRMLPKLVAAYSQEPARLIGALGAMQDFLDRSMALIGESYIATKEAALRASEESLAITLASIGDAVIATDTQGRIERLNPVAEQLTGWKQSECLGRPLEEVFRIENEDTGQPAPDPVLRVLREGTVVGLANHTVLISRQGQRWPIGDSAAPIRTSTGELRGAVLVFRDMSVEYAAAATLRKSEQTLAATLAAIHEGISIVDPQGKVLYRNPTALRLISDTSEHIQDSTGVYFIDGQTRCPPEQFPVARALRGEIVRDCELLVRNYQSPSGVHLCVNAAAIRGHAGELLGAVASFRDVSYRWHLEEQRTRATEFELQSRRMQEASRLKSEFLANMSHELRTPLNSIIGFSELLQDGRVGPIAAKQQEFLGDILTSGRHLLQLINDILDLAKVESGKLEFHPEPINLGRVVAEVTSILRATSATKHIPIETFVAEGLGEIVLDAARLKQVLYNYLSNALKFTPEGGKIALRIEPAAPEQIRLTVEDNGIGIAPSDLARLFVEFQQLEAGAAKKHEGTGLGLALTKRLVEAQGGTVGVTSELGVGSRFYAVLPCRMRGGEPRVPFAPLLATGAAGHPTVLIVEDELKDQETIAHTLLAAGYGVEFAVTGARAVAMASERTYAAITLDLILPDTSGLDVLRAIRSSGKNQNIPVVLITVVAEKIAAGFRVSGVLPKPLDGEALLTALQRAGVASTEHGTVFVIDDDAASLKLMAATLQGLRFRPACYLDGASALGELAVHQPIAIILDLLMPGMDGLQFLQRLRDSPAHRNIPVLIWTTKDLSLGELQLLHASAKAVIQKGDSDLVTELSTYLGLLSARPTPER